MVGNKLTRSVIKEVIGVVVLNRLYTPIREYYPHATDFIRKANLSTIFKFAFDINS